VEGANRLKKEKKKKADLENWKGVRTQVILRAHLSQLYNTIISVQHF